MPHAPNYDSGLYEGNNATNIFSLSSFNRKIASIIIQPVPEQKSEYQHKTTEVLQRVNQEADKSDVKGIPTFQSTRKHTDTSPEDLIQKWHIIFAQADHILKKTPQKIICSAILPLSHQYRTDRKFNQNILSGKVYIDKMNGKCK